MLAAHSFLYVLTVYSFHNREFRSWLFLEVYTLSRSKIFPSLFPIPKSRQEATTSQSPTSFSIPQTSRVSNAPILRNIRRSSSRNHRLLSRETTLKGTLSSRKIKGVCVGGGGNVGSRLLVPRLRIWPPQSDVCRAISWTRLLTSSPARLYKQRAERKAGGGCEGYLPVQGFGPHRRLRPTRTIVPKFPTPTPDRKW